MRNFHIKMALLGFSFLFAGCTTPFVEVKVNSDGYSTPHQQGDGGGCTFPCYCPTCGGGGMFKGDQGHEAKVIHVEPGQAVYTLLDGEGRTIRVISPPRGKKVESGDTVTIRQKGLEWFIESSQKKQ